MPFSIIGLFSTTSSFDRSRDREMALVKDGHPAVAFVSGEKKGG
jgi:hypothetical protein